MSKTVTLSRLQCLILGICVSALFFSVPSWSRGQDLKQQEFTDRYTHTVFMNCTGQLDNYALLFVAEGIEVMFDNSKKYKGPLRVYLPPGFRELQSRLDTTRGFTTYTTEYEKTAAAFAPGEKYLLSVTLGDKAAVHFIKKLGETETKDIDEKYSGLLKKKDGLDFRTTQFAASLERLTYSENLDCNPCFLPVLNKLAFLTGGYDRAIVVITPGENLWERAVIPEQYPLKGAGSFDWMPDGKSVVCVIEKEEGTWNIAKLEAVPGKLQYEKRNEKNIAEAAEINIEQYQPAVVVDTKDWVLKWSRPRLSPDGAMLYFDYELNGKWNMAAKDLQNGLVSALGEGSRPAVSNDGNWLVYVDRGGLYAKPLPFGDDNSGLALVEDKNYTCENPEWSPDDKYVAFQAKFKNEWRSEELYMVSFGSKKLLPLTQGGSMSCYEPNWGSDGYVYFRAKQDKGSESSDIWRLKPVCE